MIALTDAQIARAYEAGMDDAAAADHDRSGTDRRLRGELWIWARVMGDEPMEAYGHAVVTEVAHRYLAGYADYW